MLCIFAIPKYTETCNNFVKVGPKAIYKFY